MRELADRLMTHFGLRSENYLSRLLAKIEAGPTEEIAESFVLALQESRLRTYCELIELVERLVDVPAVSLGDPDGACTAAKDKFAKLLVVMLREASQKVPR